MEIKVGDVTAMWDEYASDFTMSRPPTVTFADGDGNLVIVPQSLVTAVERLL